MRYAHADRGISCPRSFSSERLCMQRSGEYLNNSNDKSGEIMASDDELEQRLLTDELSAKNEATTVESPARSVGKSGRQSRNNVKQDFQHGQIHKRLRSSLG